MNRLGGRLTGLAAAACLAGLAAVVGIRALAADSEASGVTGESVGTLTKGEGVPGKDPGSWPQFRGPGRDAIASDAGGLLRAWPADGPKTLWTITGLGPGYSSPAVHAGKVYFNDYDERARQWMVRCHSLADGKEIWRWSYPRLIRKNHGITRSVPVVDDKYVVSIDPMCVLHGFDAATGKRLWAHDLVEEFGVQVPDWYNGQCPLAEKDSVVVGVGGKDVLMAGFDKATGEVLWKTPNPEAIKLSHSSVMPMTLAGVRQYVWCTMDGVVGLDATEGGKHELLWQGPVDESGKYAWLPKTAVAPSAVQIPGDRVFMTSSYDVGSVMFKVAKVGEKFTARPLFTLKFDQFASDCHTPIVCKDRIFAVSREKFTCLDFDGKVLFSSPDGVKFGLGGFMLADGMFFVLEGDSGKLHLAEASIDGWKELAAAQPLAGREVWAPPVLVNGKLLVRDMKKMVCLEVGPSK